MTYEHEEVINKICGFLLSLKELEIMSLKTEDIVFNYLNQIEDYADDGVWANNSKFIAKAISLCDVVLDYLTSQEELRTIPSKACVWLKSHFVELKEDIAVEHEIKTSA